MQMEEQEKHCFGTEGCIKLLATCQIIFYSGLCFLFCTGLVTIAMVGPEELDPVLHNTPAFKPYGTNPYALLIFMLVFMILYYFLGVVMGVTLFRGVTQRNLRNLKAWTFYAICSVALSFCEALFGKPRGPDEKALLQLIATCAFYGFCDLLVRALMLEIRASPRRDIKTTIVVQKV